jgi:hypothetical protein
MTAFSKVKFQGDRIRLPDHLVERAKNAHLAGNAPIQCWLLVVNLGRYRLVTEETEDLSQLLRQIEEIEAPADVFEGTDSNPTQAARARVIPCVVSPPPPGWRVNLPKEAKELVPEREERRFVYVMIVAGFIELWFPDTLRQAVAGPISEILS